MRFTVEYDQEWRVPSWPFAKRHEILTVDRYEARATEQSANVHCSNAKPVAWTVAFYALEDYGDDIDTGYADTFDEAKAAAEAVILRHLEHERGDELTLIDKPEVKP